MVLLGGRQRGIRRRCGSQKPVMANIETCIYKKEKRYRLTGLGRCAKGKKDCVACLHGNESCPGIESSGIDEARHEATEQ